jgi:hypothetical protein
LNRPVKIVTTTELIEGIATDVDETGALVLKVSMVPSKGLFMGIVFISHDFNCAGGNRRFFV